MFLVGLFIFAIGPGAAWVGILVLLCAFIVMVKGASDSTPKPKTPREEEEELVVVQPGEPAPQVQPAPQPVTREIYKEREIIREIVKIRCRNCGTLFEEKLNRCPHCGAPP